MKTNKKFSSEDTSVIDIQEYGIITLVQLKHKPINSLEFISLSKAFTEDSIRIEEVSEVGDVNELLFTNLSNKKILILDGDILQGAKQNRVVNTSILIDGNSKLNIPVSCVEQGRWSSRSQFFSPSDEVVNRKTRLDKSMDIYDNEPSRKHFSNQNKVWSNVSMSIDATESHSRTSCYSDIMDSKRDEYKDVMKDFILKDGANGISYFINDNLYGIEIFNRVDVYSDYFQKILNSIAIEVDIFKRRNIMSESESLKENKITSIIRDTLDEYNENSDKIDSCNAVGLGKEERLLTSTKMYYDLSYQQQTVHQSVLVMDKNDQRTSERMMRYTNPNSDFELSRERQNSGSRISRMLRNWFKNDEII
jgi:hypothetical protein